MNGTIVLTVNRAYRNLGRAQARFLAASQGLDVHLFEENGGSQRRSVSDGSMVHHENQLAGSLVEGLPSSRKWPSVVFCRLFVPHFLRDRNYDRILYLDVDTAVTGSLAPLLETDLEGHPIAAVHEADLWTERSPIRDHANKRDWLDSLGITGDRYFNSGVLLFDADAFSRVDIAGDLWRFFERYGEAARMWDQDFLNHRFQNDWKELSPRWNFQAQMICSGLQSILEPVIFHFTETRKPWQQGYYFGPPGHAEYFAKISKLSGEPLSSFPPHLDASFFRRTRYAARSLMFRLGVRRSPSARKLRRITKPREAFIRHIEASLRDGRFAFDFDFHARLAALADQRVVFNGNEAYYA